VTNEQNGFPEPDGYPDDIVRAAESLCAGVRDEAAAQPEQLHLRGLLAAQRGERGTAIACLSRAIELDSSTGSGLSDVTKAMRLDPGRRRDHDAEAHAGRGEALMERGRLDEALREFRAALLIDPKDVRAARGLLGASGPGCSQAEAVSARLALGAALFHEDRFDEAEVVFREVAERQPDSLRGLLGLARVLREQGQTREAIRVFEAVTALDPGYSNAHTELGRALQLDGEFERGWDEFSWFHDTPSVQVRNFEQPVWDGRSLNGRTILVWTDQALGDDIQLIRYAARIRQCSGARLIVECQKRLGPLLERIAGVERVVVRGAPLPAFDAHVPLLLVPKALRARGDAIPSDVPYLSVDPDLVKKWRDDLKPDREPIIGISWGGNPTNVAAKVRFATLRNFAALREGRGVRFISLQMGPQAPEALAPPPGLRVELLQDDTHSMADTAALILNLDLIITVDTMIAHLSGALAKPVWVVLPHLADWRWLRETNQSRWYPTMRLFRQSRDGDWAGVFAHVRSALDEAVRTCATRAQGAGTLGLTTRSMDLQGRKAD
jgi:tetratricopeptide (TPR) repeat protein